MNDNLLGGRPSSEEKNSENVNSSNPEINSQDSTPTPTMATNIDGNTTQPDNNYSVEPAVAPSMNTVVPPQALAYDTPAQQSASGTSSTVQQQPSYGAPPQQPPATLQPGGFYNAPPATGNPYQVTGQGYGPVVPNAQTAVFPQKKKSAAPWIAGIIIIILGIVFAYVYFASDSSSNSFGTTGNSLTKMNGYIENGQNSELKEYLAKNASIDLDEYNESTYSPVYTAVYYENTEALQMLLDAGADPNLTDTYAGETSGKSPLFFALSYECSEALTPLIDAGSNVNASASNGTTPLMVAVMNGEEDTTLLLNAGAETSAKTKSGWSILSYATYAGDQDLYEKFVDQGLDESIVDQDGYNLAHIALWGNEVDIIPFIVNRGITLSTQNVTSGDTLLHIAGGGDAIAYVLDNFDVDVNALNNYGETALCYRADRLDPKGIELLLDAGSDPNFIGSDGKTPLMYATANSDASEVIPLLIAAGADVTIKDDSGNDAYYYGKDYYELPDSVLNQLKSLNA